jgi:hypothetical protein
LPDGGELLTLRDAGVYIRQLPKSQHEASDGKRRSRIWRAP